MMSRILVTSGALSRGHAGLSSRSHLVVHSGLLSGAKQKIVAMIGKQPLSKAQSDAIDDLTRVPVTFLAAFDAQTSGATPWTQAALG